MTLEDANITDADITLANRFESWEKGSFIIIETLFAQQKRYNYIVPNFYVLKELKRNEKSLQSCRR